MDHGGGFEATASRAVGRRQLIAGAGVAVMAAGLAACDSGDDERSDVTSSAGPDTSGAPSTTSAPSTTGSDVTTASAPESSAPAGGASEEDEVKAIALFATPLQNQFAAWAFEYVAEGADVGEIEAIANDVASEDDAAYYDAWYEHATRHRAKAEEAEAQGKSRTALYHHLRAAVYASVSYKLLFGAPVDPRLATAFETQTTSFDRAMALIDPPAERLDVTLDGNQLVVYFLRAKDAAPGEPRPTRERSTRSEDPRRADDRRVGAGDRTRRGRARRPTRCGPSAHRPAGMEPRRPTVPAWRGGRAADRRSGLRPACVVALRTARARLRRVRALSGGDRATAGDL